MGSAPTRGLFMFMQHGGGAIARVAADSCAFPNRDARYWVMIEAMWMDAARDDEHIGAVEQVWRAVGPLTHGFYVNIMSEDQFANVEANYGARYRRLVKLKRQVDAANLFRLNANVRPG